MKSPSPCSSQRPCIPAQKPSFLCGRTHIVLVLAATFALVVLYAVRSQAQRQSNSSVTRLTVTPANTVLLDPRDNGTGIGLLVSRGMTPNKAYRIGASVRGSTAGPTKALFLWMGGYIDDEGINHPTQYFVLQDGHDMDLFYPKNHRGTGPPVLAFFADSSGPDDNSARADIIVRELN